MQTPSEKLLALAGLDFTQPDTGEFHGLSESIWQLRRTPDDVLQRAVAAQLDSDLAEVVNCMFVLDQDMLKPRHAYAVSGLGRALSQAALSCSTHKGTHG